MAAAATALLLLAIGTPSASASPFYSSGCITYAENGLYQADRFDQDNWGSLISASSQTRAAPSSAANNNCAFNMSYVVEASFVIEGWHSGAFYEYCGPLRYSGQTAGGANVSNHCPDNSAYTDVYVDHGHRAWWAGTPVDSFPVIHLTPV